jgi:LmbE family N-acetylglucosaminyl deacetylase
LAVLAHPDDETFGTGGTLALYAHAGASVHLICATRGEVGDAPPELLRGFRDVGDLREHELRCAADHLRLASVRFLGYRDSGMPGSPDNQHPRALAAAPLEEVAGRIVAQIRELRPQVVITFDPIGGYFHPDHIAIQRATSLAFQASGDPARYPGTLPAYQPQRLYYHTFSRRMLRWALRLLTVFGFDPRHFGRNRDIDLTRVAAEDFPVHARIDFRAVARAKALATACHASQGGPPSGGLAAWFLRRAGETESFMRAYPPAPQGLMEKDLFDGVSLD